MRHATLATTSLVVALSTGFGIAPSKSADLVWQVENPFRFFKRSASFEAQEKAFAAVRGDANAPLPDKIIWKTERRLNDPDCKDATSPTACAGTARARYETSRQGWAAQTLDFTCFDRNARPRRYMTTCDRQYSWGTAKEDYVLPDAHTVIVSIAPDVLAAIPAGDCAWVWTPRRAGVAGETRKQACKEKLVIKRLPYSNDRNTSGAAVKVTLPDGRELADPAVVVEDLFIVAMGDSFMSGEGNPDKPVVFSPTREMVYDPTNSDTRDVASHSVASPSYGVASAGGPSDPKSLPKRRMEDEQKSLIYRPNSREFQDAFDKSGAQWLSTDCHRSQYGYPFRVSLELALENRHRAVTLVSVACSGADIVEGLFTEMTAREKFSEPGGAKVVAQLDQLSDLICRSGPAGRTASGSYALPVYSAGSTSVGSQTVAKRWCPPANRKRPVDLVLLSIGGNDVSFSALAMYATTNSADDLAPIAGWIGSQIRFSPQVSRVYMNVLDQRFKAVKQALADGFGIEPGRVLQNAYEQIQFDETGGACGLQPTLGLDVHPKLAFNRDRVTEVTNFARDLQVRLECIADARKPGCPAGLATGTGTGFRFVSDHLAEFTKRGLCARDPSRAFADQIAMGMPRMSRATQDFEPYSPAHTLPYAHKWRLIRNPNDSFLAANTHREGISLFDLLQPAYAALYSGAFHPTAEGHAIVADHVVKHAREIVDAKGGPQRQALRE
jgi:lysophospholipase L1-like esterase